MRKTLKSIKIKCAHKYRSLGLMKFKEDRVLVTLDMPIEVYKKYKHHFEEK